MSPVSMGRELAGVTFWAASTLALPQGRERTRPTDQHQHRMVVLLLQGCLRWEGYVGATSRLEGRAVS